MTLILNARRASNIAIVLFFAYRVWYAMLRFNSNSITEVISVILPYFFVLIALLLDKRKIKAVIILFAVLVVCSLCFLITYLFHPEYTNWFNHLDYGVFNNVFYPTDGLFAVLFIAICDDIGELKKCLRIVAFLLFIYAIYQIIPVMQTGHWTIVSKAGVINEKSYSLGYGYRTAFSVVFLLNDFFDTKKIQYLIPSVIGFILVFNYGGRGCILVILIFLFANILERFRKNMSPARLVLFIIIFSVIFFAIFNLDTIAMRLINITGSTSRNLEMLSSGNILSDNGRNVVWQMAADLIKTGGFFGHGVYGDRYVIGRQFSWGYSHNIFLELLVSFGVIGAILIIVLIVLIIKYFIYEMDKHWRSVFICFLSLSCQLLISDSFWYNTPFWALIGILIIRNSFLSKQSYRMTRVASNNDV